jgi:hypothetical protein
MLLETALGLVGGRSALCIQPSSEKKLWASCVEGQPISLRDYFSVTWSWPYNLTTALFLGPSNAGVQGLEICRRIFQFSPYHSTTPSASKPATIHLGT